MALCECGCGGETRLASTPMDKYRGYAKGEPLRFIGGHAAPPSKRLDLTRYTVLPNGCWRWDGYVNPNGYGWAGNRGPAHRAVYEHLRGPIPAGLTLDHLCRFIRCVNPDHLEPVSIRVNLLRGNTTCGVNARKTHCVHGHPLSGDNLYEWRGHRACKTCQRLRARATSSRQQAEQRSD